MAQSGTKGNAPVTMRCFDCYSLFLAFSSNARLQFLFKHLQIKEFISTAPLNLSPLEVYPRHCNTKMNFPFPLGVRQNLLYIKYKSRHILQFCGLRFQFPALSVLDSPLPVTGRLPLRYWQLVWWFRAVAAFPQSPDLVFAQKPCLYLDTLFPSMRRLAPSLAVFLTSSVFSFYVLLQSCVWFLLMMLRPTPTLT